MPDLPDRSTYVVIGGGVHGLSSAYHLALELEASGRRSGEDVVVLTPDIYPVVDFALPNAYLIMNSNHGFKMIGLGKLVAQDILGGGESRLDAFRLSRYEQGVTHAISHSPYPWN
jgi:glycine/D-amino acid oxidase-like deaminating enzyme